MPVSRAYHTNESVSSRRRSQPATSVAKAGAPRPIRMAAAVMSWPAWGIDTFSEVLMSLSVPGTTMTPVPMTKLPIINAHSERGRALSVGGIVVVMPGGVDSQRQSMGGTTRAASERESPREHPQQSGGDREVARKFADRHVAHAGPEGKAQPAGHRADRITHAGQPGQQTGLGAEALQPVQHTHVGRVAVACLVDHAVCAVTHPPADRAAQRVARGGDQPGGPENLRG